MSHISYPHPHVTLRIISEGLMRPTWRPLTPIPTPIPTTASMMRKGDNRYTVSIHLTTLQSDCIRILVVRAITTVAVLMKCGISGGGGGGGKRKG